MEPGEESAPGAAAAVARGGGGPAARDRARSAGEPWSPRPRSILHDQNGDGVGGVQPGCGGQGGGELGEEGVGGQVDAEGGARSACGDIERQGRGQEAICAACRGATRRCCCTCSPHQAQAGRWTVRGCAATKTRAPPCGWRRRRRRPQQGRRPLHPKQDAGSCVCDGSWQQAGGGGGGGDKEGNRPRRAAGGGS